MNPVEVNVPDVGVEGEVEVIEICVSVGDMVEVDSSIVVLESDKATVEVPCPVAGNILEITVQEGAKVCEGDLLLRIESTSAETESKNEAVVEQKVEVSSETASSVDETNQSEVQNVLEDVEVKVPDLGGSDLVEVIEVSATVGAQIEVEETLVVLESDKASMEIPSSVAGELLQLNVNVGDKVAEGDIIATVRSMSSIKEATDSAAAPNKPAATVSQAEEKQSAPKSQMSPPITEPSESNGGSAHAGPAVRKLARELGVDLNRVASTGRKNRILKEDLHAYVKLMVSKSEDRRKAPSNAVQKEVKLPDFAAFGEVSWSAMSKIQRLTAENMQTSWLTVPHVTQFDEADITSMEVFRKEQKAKAEERGLKLTPVAFLLKACGNAMRALPQFNVSLDMSKQQIVQKNYVHIGLAVDTPNGLVVPVIRDVDTKSLWQLAEECQTLAAKAKDKKLMPADMQGGCFTISSLGGLGGTAFTPIVNTPEVAILGVSKAQYKPVYDGKDFTPRLMLPLSLSYDHRAVNGADAARFTSFLSRVLGDLRELLL